MGETEGIAVVTWCWGDSFDFYSAVADAAAGHWDSSGGASNWIITTGRFTGSQAVGIPPASSQSMLVKSSGVNDAVHKLNVAVFQSLALSGTTNGICLQLLDGVTNQCCVCFRSDGAILLTSGASSGATLATYTGAFSQSVWTEFEIEVVINNTTGSFTVRKNGNTSNDFSATGLNTRGGTANNYANKLQVITGAAAGGLFTSNTQRIDDLLWRSDASSLAWIGDVRSYQLMPASDASVQFAKSTGATATITPYATTSTAASTSTRTRYAQFTAQFDGTIGSIICPLSAGYTGNMKCSLFASSGSAPTTVLGSATPIVNPVTGNNTFTFPSPVSVTKGTQYYVGFATDNVGTYASSGPNGNLGQQFDVAYGSFPVASPAVTSGQIIVSFSYVTTLGGNFALANDPQQDGTTSYVFDATVGHADLYAIQPLPVTPTLIVGVNTRGFVAKSDAGARVSQMQVKSGATTVQSATLALATSFAYQSRFDTVDPNTGAAWTAAAVNALQIGPLVQA